MEIIAYQILAKGEEYGVKEIVLVSALNTKYGMGINVSPLKYHAIMGEFGIKTFILAFAQMGLTVQGMHV